MIKVVTDSCADLSLPLIAQHQITVVPMNLHFGTETVKVGADFDAPSFYRRVDEMRTIPKTSQPSPGDFAAAYRQAALAGDELLSVHISSKLSGTSQSAEIAAKEVAGIAKVYVFDSLSGSLGEGFMALEAARMAAAGQDLAAILKRLEVMRANMSIVLTPEQLKYLQMSGRVSNVQAVLGSMLSLKPIINVEGGMLKPVARIRTRAKALDYLLSYTQEKFGKQPINLAVVHAQTPQEANILLERARGMFDVREALVAEISVVIAAHLGPGCVGLIAYPA